MLLDEIFHPNNFRNEIIWYYKGGLKNTHNIFPKKHDNIYHYTNIPNHDSIYFYTKSSEYFFNLLRKTTNNKEKVSLWERWGKYSIDGKNIRLCDIPETDRINRQRQINKFKNKHNRLPKDNDILYTIEFPLLEDVWDDCSPVYRLKHEKIGYKTQKPESLIQRIIEATTETNDLVLDFFGGGGTTAKVAHDMGRKFIIGDVSPVAYRVMIDRLNDIRAKFKMVNPPLTRKEWLEMNSKEFERKICMFMGWEHNPSSQPIDGWTDKTKKNQ